MALTFTKLADSAFVPDTVGSIYSNPSLTKTYIKGVRVFNGNTTPEVVKLYVVPNSAGSLGTASLVHQAYEITLGPSTTAILPFDVSGVPTVLTDENDSVQAVTTTASKVTITPLGATE